MTWQVAPAILQLRSQLDAAYPNRDKRSDGTIGDASHQAHSSDHNPDSQGFVCAWDVTHGPYWHVPTIDCGPLVDTLVAHRDPRIKYLIFERRIWLPATGWSGYSGTSPHLEHLHISITQAGKRDASPWAITNAPAPTPQTPTTAQEHDDMTVFINNPHAPGQIWVTDFVVKRPVSNIETVKAAQAVAAFRGISVGPIDINPAAFDEIPTR